MYVTNTTSYSDMSLPVEDGATIYTFLFAKDLVVVAEDTDDLEYMP